MQDPNQLAQHLVVQVGNASDVATRLGQACDKPVAHWIGDVRHDDRYCLRRPLKRARTRYVSDHDHVDFLSDQFAGQGIHAVHVATGVDDSILDILPFLPAEIMHSLL